MVCSAWLRTVKDQAKVEVPSNPVPSMYASPNVPTKAGVAHTGLGLANKSARESPLRWKSTLRRASSLSMDNNRSFARPSLTVLSVAKVCSTRTVLRLRPPGIIAGSLEENKKSPSKSTSKRPATTASLLSTQPGTVSTHVRSSPFFLSDAATFALTTTRCHLPSTSPAFAVSPNVPSCPTPPSQFTTASPSVGLSFVRPLVSSE
mmetsp:Transcript_40535/g.79830  ORF Transcript_40535/g.79830 Transcript_40535/m.79830 type:complete len:205 (+) Transcript_40535:1206-1820(+)